MTYNEEVKNDVYKKIAWRRSNLKVYSFSKRDKEKKRWKYLSLNDGKDEENCKIFFGLIN